MAMVATIRLFTTYQSSQLTISHCTVLVKMQFLNLYQLLSSILSLHCSLHIRRAVKNVHWQLLTRNIIAA